MTLEVQEKLIFSGPFNEKLKGFLTLKNNDQDKKVALKFFSNVYTTKIAVWPKKVLLLPNETVTATFKYRPSHPQGNDRIRIRSAVLKGSSIMNMENFDQIWNQLEAFRHIETRYVEIVHAENNAVQPQSDEFNGGSVEVNANPDVWNNVVENNAQAWTQNQLWSNTVQGHVATVENACPQYQFGEGIDVQETDQNAWEQDQNAWGQDQNAWGQDQNAWGQDQIADGEIPAQATDQDQVGEGIDVQETNQNDWGQDQNAWGQDQNAWGQDQNAWGQDQNAWGQDQITDGEIPAQATDQNAWGQDQDAGEYNTVQEPEHGANGHYQNDAVNQENEVAAGWGLDENNNAANIVDNNAWGADWGPDENNNVANVHYDAAVLAHDHQVNPGDVGHDQAVNANLENANVMIDTLFALFAVLLFGIMIGKGMI